MTTNPLSESQKHHTNVEEISVLLEHTEFQELEKEYQNLPFTLLRKVGIIQAKRAIQTSLTPDKNLIQVIQALDEAHSSFNLASERFTVWYSQLHGRSRAKLEDILANEDVPSQMHPLKDHIENTKKLIKDLSSYLDINSPKIFPNLVNILGTQLTVRIVSLAGDLSKLARMPASTIQLLGAEKALFRHMADGSPPPKHGILYQHPTIKRATGKDKGRSSRKLAAKVAIASKIDYFGEKNE